MSTIKRTGWCWFVVIVACGGEKDEAGPVGKPHTSAFPACDVLTDACQQSVIDEVTKLRGSQGTIPKIVVRSEAEVVAEFNTTATAEERAQFTTQNSVLSLMGLSTEDIDYDTYTQNHLEQVAAYYRSDTKDVTIINHGTPLDARNATLVLAHELVHALQDADGLLTMADDTAKDGDAQLAHRSVVEGEAQLYALLASLDMDGYRPSQVNWASYFDDWQADELSQAIASDTPVYDASLQFVYAWGTEYVYGIWAVGGAAAVKSAFTSLPETTYRLGIGAVPAEVDGFADVAVPTLADTYELAVTDHLGWWIFNVWCRQVSTVGAGVCDASVADTITGILGPDNSLTTVWRVRMESASDAQLLQNSLLGNATYDAALVDGDVVISAKSGALLDDLVTGWGPAPTN